MGKDGAGRGRALVSLLGEDSGRFEDHRKNLGVPRFVLPLMGGRR